MPMPHDEMRRLIQRRIRGLSGADRVRMLESLLEDLPGYYQGPYGQLRKWVMGLIADARAQETVVHHEAFFLARQGAAQVALVGPPNAGKSSLLHALTGRQVAIGDYPFTTLRPVEGMVTLYGAPVQLVDLPGLIAGAGDGKGRGKSVLAAARMADALVVVAPLTDDGQDAVRMVRAELVGAAISAPWGLVGTKRDLDEGETHARRLRAAYPNPPWAVCSPIDGTGLEAVRAVIWDVSGLMRVYCHAPGAAPAAEPTVLPRGTTVTGLAASLNRGWVGRLRGAHVTGPSAAFPRQLVGVDHVLRDKDTVVLVLAR